MVGGMVEVEAGFVAVLEAVILEIDSFIVIF